MEKTHRALIAVDVQREFGSGNMDKYNQIVSYIGSEGYKYDRVVATVCLNDEHTNMFKSGAWTSELVQPMPLDFNADRVFKKHGYGLPITALEEIIDGHEHRGMKFDVIGYNTDCCVLAIALQLFDRQCDVRVLSNYCYSSSGEDHHQRGVSILKDLIGSYLI